MSGDCMGNKQRAWLCAGNGWFWDWTGDHVQLLWAAGERPILAVPLRYCEDLDLAFGWGFAELVEYRGGWLGLMGRVIVMSDPEPEVA